MADKPKLIVILGATATGKTKMAVKLASRFNGEIVSADSRQVYRGMDIGTGKDLGEYEIHTPYPSQEGNWLNKIQSVPLYKRGQGCVKIKIPYHLIDVVSPNTKFSLAKYQKLAYKAIYDIIKRGKTPFLVGGTGLYIKSIVEGTPLLNEAKPNLKLRKILDSWDNEKILKELKKLDPNLDEKNIQNNKRRMIRYIEIMDSCKKPISEIWKIQKKEGKYDCLMLGIFLNSTSFEEGGRGRFLMNTKIDQRVDRRLDKEKMVEEVKRLHKEGVSWRRLESFGLEYKFIAKYLQGKLEYNEMVNLLKIASHQFAKRQMTWFKRDKGIKWITKYGEAKKEISKLF